MNSNDRKAYLCWIVLTEAVGALSGWLTKDGAKFFNEVVTKPPFSPPAAVFPVAWFILYLLMGIGAARIYLQPASETRSRALFLYAVQLAFNFLWSIVFFNFRLYLFSFIWLILLWMLILAMTLTFRKLDVPASRMQIPYLLWVLFAGYLNLGVWVLNR